MPLIDDLLKTILNRIDETYERLVLKGSITVYGMNFTWR